MEKNRKRKENENKGGGNGTAIIISLLGAALIGGIIYFKVIAKK